jgi:phosphoribosylformimino-5-aminoimidazole carboxamide ribotide isomerase
MMTIIPAMDIIDGQCVRLTKGDFDTKKVYDNDPVAVAQRFEDIGVKRLHMVDLDGARTKQVVNQAVLEEVANKTGLEIDFGGGVQSDEDIRIVFDCGAKQVTAGSVSVKNPQIVKSWLDKYEIEKIILGADVKERMIAISGWQEKTNLNIEDFLENHVRQGFKYVICTDISRDGVLEGPAIELYEELKSKFSSIYLIASGGVGVIDDLSRLADMGADGVIIGKALYEGRIKLEELKPFLC